VAADNSSPPKVTETVKAKINGKPRNKGKARQVLIAKQRRQAEIACFLCLLSFYLLLRKPFILPSISAQLLVCPKRAKLPSYLAFYLLLLLVCLASFSLCLIICIFLSTKGAYYGANYP
jgi:hypothetical protein